MTVGEMLKLFKQYNIPNDAVLMSDSGWEAWATDMDGIYYNKTTNTIVFTPEFSDCDHYYWDKDWIACKKFDEVKTIVPSRRWNNDIL